MLPTTVPAREACVFRHGEVPFPAASPGCSVPPPSHQATVEAGPGPGRTYISVTLSPSALRCGTGKEAMPGTRSTHQIRQELQLQDAGQPSPPRQQPSTRQHKPHSLARPGPGLRRQDIMLPPFTPELPRRPPSAPAAGAQAPRVCRLPRHRRSTRCRGSHGRAAAAPGRCSPQWPGRNSTGTLRRRRASGTARAARHLPPAPRAGGQRRRLPLRRLPMMLQNARSGGRWRSWRCYLRGLGRPLPARGRECGRRERRSPRRQGSRSRARRFTHRLLLPPADNKATPALAPAQAGELPAK